MQELYIQESTGQYRIASLNEVWKTVSHTLNANFATGMEYNNPGLFKKMLATHYKDQPHESFLVVFLNSRHQIVAKTEAHGTVNSAQVYPREIMREAIHQNASALVLSDIHHPLICFLYLIIYYNSNGIENMLNLANSLLYRQQR